MRVLTYPSDNRYRVSDQGDVWRGERKLKGDIKTQDGKPPYRRIRIGRNGPWHYVHDMVLETFVGRKPKGRCSRHLNGNSLDNRRVNLRYATYSENNYDRVRHGNHFRVNQTACIHGHRFTPENTYINTVSGARQCRTCARNRTRVRKVRKG